MSVQLWHDLIQMFSVEETRRSQNTVVEFLVLCPYPSDPLLALRPPKRHSVVEGRCHHTCSSGSMLIQWSVLQYFKKHRSQQLCVVAQLCVLVRLGAGDMFKITQKVMDGFSWNFQGLSEMLKGRTDFILGVIWKKSWILDHFQIFDNIVLNGAGNFVSQYLR